MCNIIKDNKMQIIFKLLLALPINSNDLNYIQCYIYYYLLDLPHYCTIKLIFVFRMLKFQMLIII